MPYSATNANKNDSFRILPSAFADSLFRWEEIRSIGSAFVRPAHVDLERSLKVWLGGQEGYEVFGGVVCSVEDRVHGIGRIPTVGILKISGEIVPVEAEDVETSCRD